MTKTEHCPEISVLSNFLDRELPEEEVRWVRFHVQKCAPCFRQLQSIEAGENVLVTNLGKPVASSEYSRKQECIPPETMTAYLHGLLSVEEKTLVGNHLDLCDACLSEFGTLAKTEMRMEECAVEPLPDSLRERVEAIWTKGEREQILRVAIRLTREGIELIRESLFPQAVIFQEVFAQGGAYRDALPESSLPSGIFVKRNLSGMEISLQIQQERENSVALKIKIVDENSNPLGGQRIFLRRGQVLLYSERTDANGCVDISNLEPGAYQLGILTFGKESYVDLNIGEA